MKLLFLLFTILFCVSSSADDRPNVIFILIDDLGYNGISCFGNELVDTPNIDSFAKKGMKFTDAYAMPQCSPTRAAFLTGQYCARTKMTSVVKEFVNMPKAAVIDHDPVRVLPMSVYTIGKMFRDAGYVSATSGKWHVDLNESENKQKLGKEKYFDSYGFSMFPKGETEGDPKRVMAHTTGLIEFIRQNKDKPFFAYLAHNTVHTALEAPKEYVDKYVAKGFKKYPSVPHSAEYLAMIDYLDYSVGLITVELDKQGLTDNTMIVFMSDNGGHYKIWGKHGDLRRGKGAIHEGGIRVPMIVQWPKAVKAGKVCDIPVHIVDWYATFLDLVNGKKPQDHILDGESLLPLLKEEAELQREAIMVHTPNYVANYHKTPATMVRKGDYKLIHFYGDQIDDFNSKKLIPGEAYALYNLRKDIGEKYNLIESHPEKFQELKKEMARLLNETGAYIPSQNLNFDLADWDFKIKSEADKAKKAEKLKKKKAKVVKP